MKNKKQKEDKKKVVMLQKSIKIKGISTDNNSFGGIPDIDLKKVLGCG